MNLKGRKFENTRLGMEIYVYDIDGKEWFIGKDMIKLLGYSENSKPLRKWGENGSIVWEENKKKIYVKTIEITGNIENIENETITYNNNITLISKDGVLQLIGGSQKLTQQQKQEWYHMFGVDNVFLSRKETEFGNVLKEALDELNVKMIPQYNIDNKYRIDFYIPKLNIAVEYDEEQHYTEYNQKMDLERQKYIEDKLGCKFIRCDYRDSDIKNVMKVVKICNEDYQNKVLDIELLKN